MERVSEVQTSLRGPSLKACFAPIITSNLYYLLSARHYVRCGIFLPPLGLSNILLLSLCLYNLRNPGVQKSQNISAAPLMVMQKESGQVIQSSVLLLGCTK